MNDIILKASNFCKEECECGPPYEGSINTLPIIQFDLKINDCKFLVLAHPKTNIWKNLADLCVKNNTKDLDIILSEKKDGGLSYINVCHDRAEFLINNTFGTEMVINIPAVICRQVFLDAYNITDNWNMESYNKSHTDNWLTRIKQNELKQNS